MKVTEITNDSDLTALRAGDAVLFSGVAYTARDAAHGRIAAAHAKDEPLPFDLDKAAIYYAGPTPARAGEIIGSCGPTTSARMDDYAPLTMELGVRIMIGKGKRSPAVVEAIKKHKAVYLVAVGGAAALIKSRVVSAEDVAYPDLGCEAVRRLTFDKLPLLVAIDSRGEGIF